jgi:hypothetical protein
MAGTPGEHDDRDGLRQPRQWPRLELLRDLNGQVVPLELPVTVRQIWSGGFSIETACAFLPDAVHAFRLTFNDESAVLRARVAYCRPGDWPGDRTVHVTGLEFVDAPHDGRSAADELVAKIASVLSFNLT